jgi:nucleoside-diphosphate-sugar epimerase
MNICVTGASGFIGQRLVYSLCEQGHSVTILSRRECQNEMPLGVNIINGDLTSETCPLDLFLDKCNVIINCAGELNNTAKMEALHVEGTQKLIQAALKQTEQRGNKIHWIQLSSVGVYGPVNGKANSERVITEDTPIQPKGEYEQTKAQADKLVIQAAESSLLTYTIIRPSNVFGQGMPNGALRALAGTVRKGLFFYIGYLKTVSTYVHVDDVIALLVLCLSDSNAKGEVFNISNDCLLEEMIEGIAMILNVKHPWLRLPEALVRALVWLMQGIIKSPLSQAAINSMVARTSYPTLKLKQRLDFTPQISVSMSMNDVIQDKNNNVRKMEL